MALKFLICFLGTMMGLFFGNYIFEKEIAYPHILKIHKKWGLGKQVDNPQFPSIIKLAFENGQPFCSAFVADNNYAITAAHCLNNGFDLPSKNPIKIYNDSGKFTGILAKAVGMALRSDLGLVYGDFTNFHKLKANLTDYGFYNKLYLSCGYPYGQNKLICNAFRPFRNDFFAIFGKGYLVPGMSGGPTIDISTGEAVGINSAVTEEGVLIYPIQGLLGAFNLE